MAAWFLAEKLKEVEEPGYKTPLSIFLDSLPENVDDYPQCWNEDKLKNLEGCLILNEISKWRERYVSGYEYICSKVEEFYKFDFEDYKRFIILCNSRCFEPDAQGLSFDYFMAPFADMINHKL